MKGIIKNYDKSKKYGFISDEYNKDYFFHISDVTSATELGKGQIVEFQPSNRVKGLRAVEIQLNFPFTQQDYAMLGNHICNIRQEKQVSLQCLSTLSNITENDISNFEENKLFLLYSDENDIILKLKNIIKALNITYIDLLLQVGFFTDEDLKDAGNLIKKNFFTIEDLKEHKQFYSEIQSGKIKLTERNVIKIYYHDGIDKKIFESLKDARKYLGKNKYFRYAQNKYSRVREIEGPLGIEKECYSFAEILQFIEPV